MAASLLAFSAHAANGPAQSPAYKECAALAKTNPQEALTKSEAWLKMDDGFAAHHCRAMALYGMGNFGLAADGLMQVRTKIPPENITLRSYVAQQGAKAYSSAGNPAGALNLLSTQVSELGSVKGNNVTTAKLTADLLLERSKINMRYGKLTEAVQDLDHAISLSPLNEGVLMQRSQAFEALGDNALAKQDAQAVLRLNPTHPDAVALMRRLRDK